MFQMPVGFNQSHRISIYKCTLKIMHEIFTGYEGNLYLEWNYQDQQRKRPVMIRLFTTKHHFHSIQIQSYHTSHHTLQTLLTIRLNALVHMSQYFAPIIFWGVPNLCLTPHHCEQHMGVYFRNVVCAWYHGALSESCQIPSMGSQSVWSEDRAFIIFKPVTVNNRTSGWVMHICVGTSTIIGSDNGLSPWTAPSHYLNQCWNIVNYRLRNKPQWNSIRN